MAFNCLRQGERVAIAEQISKSAKPVPNSKIYSECKRKFRNLIPFEAQTHIVQQIKSRTYSVPAVTLMREVPTALKHAALTLRATNQEIKRISEELKITPRKQSKQNKQDNEDIFSVPARETERVACA
jgi:hypothetical protein